MDDLGWDSLYEEIISNDPVSKIGKDSKTTKPKLFAFHNNTQVSYNPSNYEIIVIDIDHPENVMKEKILRLSCFTFLNDDQIVGYHKRKFHIINIRSWERRSYESKYFGIDKIALDPTRNNSIFFHEKKESQLIRVDTDMFVFYQILCSDVTSFSVSSTNILVNSINGPVLYTYLNDGISELITIDDFSVTDIACSEDNIICISDHTASIYDSSSNLIQKIENVDKIWESPIIILRSENSLYAIDDTVIPIQGYGNEAYGYDDYVFVWVDDDDLPQKIPIIHESQFNNSYDYIIADFKECNQNNIKKAAGKLIYFDRISFTMYNKGEIVFAYLWLTSQMDVCEIQATFQNFLKTKNQNVFEVTQLSEPNKLSFYMCGTPSRLKTVEKLFFVTKQMKKSTIIEYSKGVYKFTFNSVLIAQKVRSVYPLLDEFKSVKIFFDTYNIPILYLSICEIPYIKKCFPRVLKVEIDKYAEMSLLFFDSYKDTLEAFEFACSLQEVNIVSLYYPNKAQLSCIEIIDHEALDVSQLYNVFKDFGQLLCIYIDYLTAYVSYFDRNAAQDAFNNVSQDKDNNFQMNLISIDPLYDIFQIKKIKDPHSWQDHEQRGSNRKRKEEKRNNQKNKRNSKGQNQNQKYNKNMQKETNDKRRDNNRKQQSNNKAQNQPVYKESNAKRSNMSQNQQNKQSVTNRPNDYTNSKRIDKKQMQQIQIQNSDKVQKPSNTNNQKSNKNQNNIQNPQTQGKSKYSGNAQSPKENSNIANANLKLNIESAPKQHEFSEKQVQTKAKPPIQKTDEKQHQTDTLSAEKIVTQKAKKSRKRNRGKKNKLNSASDTQSVGDIEEKNEIDNHNTTTQKNDHDQASHINPDHVVTRIQPAKIQQKAPVPQSGSIPECNVSSRFVIVVYNYPYPFGKELVMIQFKKAIGVTVQQQPDDFRAKILIEFRNDEDMKISLRNGNAITYNGLFLLAVPYIQHKTEIELTRMLINNAKKDEIIKFGNIPPETTKKEVFDVCKTFGTMKFFLVDDTPNGKIGIVGYPTIQIAKKAQRRIVKIPIHGSTVIIYK